MLEDLLIRFGDPPVIAACGALVGLLFGWSAERSQFCLRAATVELAEGRLGPRLAVWLIVFFAALTLVQGGIATGRIDVGDARQLASAGSVSGAVLGGLMFGAGMILARGCASRLLVLSATGNLRALVTGLVLTIVAQAALGGVLAAPRESLAALQLLGAGERALPILPGIATGLGAAGLLAGLGLARFTALPAGRAIAALFVGAAVALGWWVTARLAATAFEIVPVTSITFTGPSTDTLMALVGNRAAPLSFGLGLVPGVFTGAAVSAALARRWKIERFSAETPLERYLVGAVLMGFGAMLAGGCAVGAGVSGGAILSITSILALAAMWLGACATHLALRQARMSRGSQGHRL